MEYKAEEIIELINKETSGLDNYEYKECIEIVIDELKSSIRTMKELGEI